MAEHKSKAFAISFVLVISTVVGFGRTIIVAADGSGDFSTIMEAVDSAAANDSILVRDGDYWGNNDFGEEFVLDSGLFLYAEHPGSVNVYEGGEIGVGAASVTGLRVIGNPMVITQFMLYVSSGQARIWNCQFFPAADHGCQLAFMCGGQAPYVRNCGLTMSGANWYVWNLDSTDISMPYNYYGTVDTTTIHLFIDDGHDYPGLGYVTVSPVADTFEWLAAEPRLPIAQERQIELYPNPSNGVISINMKGLQTIQQIDLFNILGQRVWSLSGIFERKGEHLKFDLPLPTGSYFISVSEPKSYHIAKLTIIR